MTKVLLIDSAVPEQKDVPRGQTDRYLSCLGNKIERFLFDGFVKEEYQRREITDSYKNYPFVANLGLLMVGTVARDAGHEVSIHQFTGNDDQKELKSMIAESEVVGITAMNTTIENAVAIATLSKRVNPNTIVVVGGPELSNTRINYMETVPQFDVLFRGESEFALAQFLSDPTDPINLQGINGISYREDGSIKTNPGINVVDISTLPAPDFTLIPYLDQSQVYLELSRGCVQQCSFCMEHITGVRFKTEEQIKAELSAIESVRKNSLLHIIDSDFAVSRQQVKAFQSAVQQVKPSNHFNVQTRIDKVDADKLRTLYANNIVSINFGLDNLSDEVLRTVKKKLTWERIVAGLQIASDNAPNPWLYRGNFIQGLPGETIEEAQLNLRRRGELLESGTLLRFRDYIFMPVSGSPIYANPALFGLAFSEGTSSFRNSVPGYHHFSPSPRFGEEIYSHHLKMRETVYNFFIQEFELQDLVKETLEETQNRKSPVRGPK
jgi:radical SAM superfamily enzyme YgiQ (UPF0313 family)